MLERHAGAQSATAGTSTTTIYISDARCTDALQYLKGCVSAYGLFVAPLGQGHLTKPRLLPCLLVSCALDGKHCLGFARDCDGIHSLLRGAIVGADGRCAHATHSTYDMRDALDMLLESLSLSQKKSTYASVRIGALVVTIYRFCESKGKV